MPDNCFSLFGKMIQYASDKLGRVCQALIVETTKQLSVEKTKGESGYVGSTNIERLSL